MTQPPDYILYQTPMRKVEPERFQRYADLYRQIKDLEEELNRERIRCVSAESKIADGIHAMDLATLNAENELFRDGLEAALTKLNQPECTECSGKGAFYDDAGYSHECNECDGVGREWVS